LRANACLRIHAAVYSHADIRHRVDTFNGGDGEMAGRRAVSNPLALAVLVQLCEGPMHPYEMAATMRSRGKERSIRLNYGSLYTVVNNLARQGRIAAAGAGWKGARAARTE